MTGVAVLFLGSCKNESSILGLDLQPPSDQPDFRVYSDFNLSSHTDLQDSVLADENLYNMLGQVNDDGFGHTKAGFYAHLRTIANSLNFGTNPIVDSIVLQLRPNTLYGDSNFSQTIEVFELNEDMVLDSNYYSNVSFEVKPTPIGSKTGILWNNSKEQVTLANGDTLGYHVRIGLDPNIGQQILDKSGSSELEDPESFIDFFKGIYVTSTSAAPAVGDGAIVAFDLVSSISTVVLYYHNDENDSISTEFVISNNSARVNAFEHDYTSAAEVQSHLADTSLGQQKFFVQSLSGLSGSIQLPDLSTWLDSLYALNKVSLVVPVVPSANEDFDVPASLLLVRVDSEGKVFFLQDITEANSLFGGTYNSSKNSYTFNITRHIHDVILGDLQNDRLAVLPAGNSIRYNRVQLGGQDNPDPASRMRLEFYYTKP